MKLGSLLWKVRGFLGKLELKLYNEHTRAIYWRKKGVQIGENVRILTDLFLTEPYLIRIGNHVTLAGGVTFLNHDGAVWLFREEFPNLQRFGTIIIEDNCFIGQNVLLLPGIKIGPDAIVAAGAVVNTDVPPGTIYGGVPARQLSTVEGYKQKIIPVWSKFDFPRELAAKRLFLEQLFWQEGFKEPIPPVSSASGEFPATE